MISFGPSAVAPTDLLNRLRIDLLTAPAPISRRSASRVLLPFVNYMQSRSSWCWAAVAMSVHRFWVPDSQVTQCEIASRVLGRPCCGDDVEASPACNVQTGLGAALDAVGHGAGRYRADSQLACSLLDARRPVGIYIEWSATAGHFAVLCGYALPATGLEFMLADPRYGARPVSATELAEGRYRGSGKWTTLYPTQRHM
jgi:hypothetical protein